MKLSQASLSLIEETISKAVSRYVEDREQTIVTDIHLQINPDSGELSIYDDEDKDLGQAVIEEWADYQDDDLYEGAERILSSLLGRMKKAGAFDKLTILKPYSFVLVDDEKETMAELLLLDDDTLLLDDELLKGLDEELNAFLKNLLEK